MNAWVRAQSAADPVRGDSRSPSSGRGRALDSAIVGKALAFQLSFDLDTGATKDYLAYAGEARAATAQAMFFGDVFRSAPFDKAATIPDATGGAPFLGGLGKTNAKASSKAGGDLGRAAVELRSRSHGRGGLAGVAQAL